MRRLMTRAALVLLPALTLLACTKADDSASDSASASVPAAPAPAMLSARDLQGTWDGQTMAADRDTVLRRWTSTQVNESTAKLLLAGSRDSITYTTRFDADSMIAESEPYSSTGVAKDPKVTFRSIGRLRDGKLVGTVTHRLATNPDSVVSRMRFESTRRP